MQAMCYDNVLNNFQEGAVTSQGLLTYLWRPQLLRQWHTTPAEAVGKPVVLLAGRRTSCTRLDLLLCVCCCRLHIEVPQPCTVQQSPCQRCASWQLE